MKYQTARFADGAFTINCPHCNGEVAVDEGQLEQINAALGGKYNCPIATCGQEIEFPTAEEAAALKAGGAAPAPQAAPAAPAASGLAPPPQSNPDAKPTAPPAEAPAPQPQQAPAAPAVEEAPQAAAPAAAATAAGGDDAIVAGFHGSKGASLEREAALVHRLSVKTILHAQCVKEKSDFDEEVSKFLSSVDEENLVEVHPVQYTDDEKKGNDFGVMILYKTTPEEE